MQQHSSTLRALIVISIELFCARLTQHKGVDGLRA
jgi:hypothetical protein